MRVALVGRRAGARQRRDARRAAAANRRRRQSSARRPRPTGADQGARRAVRRDARPSPGICAFVDAGALDRAAAAGRVARRRSAGRRRAGWRAGEPQDFIGPFVLEKRHPLLLGRDARRRRVDRSAAARRRRRASAGRRRAIRRSSACLTRRPARTDPAILFNLDLDRTNLIRSPDWPILISNLVEMRRQSLPGPERWNYRVGEWVRVRLGRDPKGPLRVPLRRRRARRCRPAGRSSSSRRRRADCSQILEGDEVLFELGVNFLDESESDLRGPARRRTPAVRRRRRGLRAESGPASDPLFWMLLAIGGGGDPGELVPAARRPPAGEAGSHEPRSRCSFPSCCS